MSANSTLLAEFRGLYERKQRIVAGTEPVSASTEIDRRIAEIMPLLVELGVNLSPSELYERLLTDPAGVTRVSGHLIRIPAAPTILRGERANFQAVLDYIPPGRQPNYEWRWRGASSTLENQFFSTGPRTSQNTLALDEMTWNLTSLQTEASFEVFAHVYLGSDTTQQTVLSSGTIQIVNQDPATAELAASSVRVITGESVEVFFRSWIPRFEEFAVDWDIDGTTVATEQPRLRQSFTSEGTKHVTARIFRVARGLFSTTRTPFREATIDIAVESAQAAGQRALNLMTQDPGPNLQATTRSVESSITALRQREGFGGELQGYYRRQREAQQTRLAAIQRLVPRLSAHMLNMPDDFFAQDTAHYDELNVYTRPVPAVMTMPGTQGAQPLAVHLVMDRDTSVASMPWHARLIDMTTSDVTISEGTGSDALTAYQAALADWVSDHPYPRGGRVDYQRLSASGPSTDFFITTNLRNTLESYLDAILMVGGVILIVATVVASGGAAAAPIATGIVTYFGPVFLAVSTARSAYAIYQNIERGSETFSTGNILEAMSIVANFTGVGGSILRRVGLQASRAVTYRVGSYLVLTSVALDAGALVYISEEGVRSLQAIRSDPTMDEGQKNLAFIRLTSALIAQGAMFIFSNRDLFRGGMRRSDFLPTDPHATAARVARTGDVRLETGERLDLAVELRRAGDPASRLAPHDPTTGAGMGSPELVDRFNQLAWLRETLNADQIRGLLPRLTTDALLGLNNITALEALALSGRLDAALRAEGTTLLNTLGPVLRGQRLNSLDLEVSSAQVKNLFDAFGAEPLRDLIDALEVARIGRLLDGMTAAQIHAEIQPARLGVAPLRNLSDSLTGAEIARLIRTHGVETVRWAAADQTGANAAALLQLTAPALANLRDVSGAQAYALMQTYGRALLDTVAPASTGSDLAMLVYELGPRSARDIAEFRQGRGEVDRLNRYAQGMRNALLAGGGTGAPPMGRASYIVDTNFMQYVHYARTKQAAGTPIPPIEQNCLDVYNAMQHDATGLPDVRVSPMTAGELHEQGTRRGTPFVNAPAAQGLPVGTSRDSAEYQNMLNQLEGAAVGGVGVGGAADRSLVADAFFTLAAAGRENVFVTTDRRVVNGLAALSGVNPATTTGAPFAPFRAQIVINGTTYAVQVVFVPGVPLPPAAIAGMRL